MPKTINPNKSLAALIHHSVAQHTGKGQDDTVAAVIDGQQPAALSQGEFVIPADVVSLLGDGNTQAGADILQSMVDKVRQMKTGSKKQPPMMQQALGKLLGNE